MAKFEELYMLFLKGLVWSFLLLNQLPEWVGDGEISVDDEWGKDFSDMPSISPGCLFYC